MWPASMGPEILTIVLLGGSFVGRVHKNGHTKRFGVSKNMSLGFVLFHDTHELIFCLDLIFSMWY